MHCLSMTDRVKDHIASDYPRADELFSNIKKKSAGVRVNWWAIKLASDSGWAIELASDSGWAVELASDGW